jgi:hypothetical protein
LLHAETDATQHLTTAENLGQANDSDFWRGCAHTIAGDNTCTLAVLVDAHAIAFGPIC